MSTPSNPGSQTSQPAGPQGRSTSSSALSSPTTVASNQQSQATILSLPTLNGAPSWSSPAPGGQPTPFQRPWNFSGRGFSLTRPWQWLDPYKYVIIAFVVYGLTLGIAASASAPSAFLGLVKAPVGTWILNILSKANDIALSFAVEDAFAAIAWAKLRELFRGGRYFVFNGLKLPTFLTLSSSTGPLGLWVLFMNSFKFPKFNEQQIWSFIRLCFVLGLIPGPGIIIVANIDQKDLVYPTETHAITGGLGAFNPDSAAVYAPLGLSLEVSSLLQSFLRDSRVAMPVDPVTPACERANTCEAFLVAGAARTIRPLPESQGIYNTTPAFRINDAPSYQIDFWEAPKDYIFKPKDCGSYGIAGTDSFGFQLCVSSAPSGELVSGFILCSSGFSPNGTCLDPTSMSGSQLWGTSAVIYRRPASLTFTRSNFYIQQVHSLGPYEKAIIHPADLLIAWNAVLYPLKNITLGNLVDRETQKYALTASMTIWLQAMIDPNGDGETMGRDWLRNLLATPLYLFQPTIAPPGAQNPTATFTNQTQIGLPPENHITGSYCRTSRRAVPGSGTVVAYGIVAGLTLILTAIARSISARQGEVSTTEFPLVDFVALTTIRKETTPFEGVKVVEAFPDPHSNSYRNRNVLERAASWKIGLS